MLGVRQRSSSNTKEVRSCKRRVVLSECGVAVAGENYGLEKETRPRLKVSYLAIIEAKFLFYFPICFVLRAA